MMQCGWYVIAYVDDMPVAVITPKMVIWQWKSLVGDHLINNVEWMGDESCGRVLDSEAGWF